MYGRIKRDIQDILKKLCEYKQIEILEGTVCSDHVHMCVKIPPKITVSKFMGYLKGKSALMIFDQYPELKKGNRRFWARGYYVDTVGRNEEQIRKYIKKQEAEDQKEDQNK